MMKSNSIMRITMSRRKVVKARNKKIARKKKAELPPPKYELPDSYHWHKTLHLSKIIHPEFAKDQLLPKNFNDMISRAMEIAINHYHEYVELKTHNGCGTICQVKIRRERYDFYNILAREYISFDEYRPELP